MHNQPVIRKAMTMLLTLVALLLLLVPVTAQANSGAPGGHAPGALPQTQGPTSPAELEAFLDRLLPEEMEENHIPGAAISVVKEGKLFFAKGYGVANVVTGTRVDPEHTVFAIGSIGKTFTWTAVMQLVEQGKLNLDADVNTYLDFRVPDTFPGKITLKHLMSHTSGFENRIMESLATDPKDVLPAREWLVAHMPARVRAPGVVAGYSNYNAMLAGYIVARVSGQPYEKYIQKNIMDPLGMAHSTVQFPLPPELLKHTSVGYNYSGGVYQQHPDYFGQSAGLPSGFHHATVTDMARFMIAHLQDGRYSDAAIPEARILKEATARQMHSLLFTHDPRLPGTAHGFFDFSDNGQRTLGHGGYMGFMNSLLLLLPDQNLGVFVAYNSMGGGDVNLQHSGFQRAFFDHYYPVAAGKPLQAPADFASRASRFAGSYRYTSRSYTTADKVGALFVVADVSDPGDGTLLVSSPYGKWRLVEVEPLYFRQMDGPVSIVFREDERGRITHLFTNYTPQFAFERLEWYETLGFLMALVAGCALVFVTTILVVLFRALRGRLSANAKPAPRGARLADGLILVISALNLLFVAGVARLGPPVFLFGFSTLHKILLGVGMVSALLTLGALVYAALAWKDRYWGVLSRAHYTLGTAAAVAFVWFLDYVNLLGWRY